MGTRLPTFLAMSPRTVQLVVQYDGTGFSGWQRQPGERTVQGAIEDVLARLCGQPVPALGSGRTDAGVHARGQSVGVRVPERWTTSELRRAMNALLPDDVWVAAAYEMQPGFHARYDATARRYRYVVGLDEDASSPFRRHWEWVVRRPVDTSLLEAAASRVVGEHAFLAFAVRGTAPAHDDHRCSVTTAQWQARSGGMELFIEANRFLHHMVRFLVGTMMDIASGKRPLADMTTLLTSSDNRAVSAPAPPHALFLERVSYPAALYMEAP